MKCNEVSDRLVESARHEVEPGRVVRSHMKICGACRERWESEQSLAAHMKALRLAAWEQRSSGESRQMLMRKFAARNRPVPSLRWYWALAAAAALAISIFAVPGIHRQPAASPIAVAGVQESAGQDSGGQESAGQDTAEGTADSQADPDAEGFVAVPFVPPLATGEMVRVVHTELNPAALASLGVSVDPAWTTQLPADVLMGEDGMPRAVRVSEVSSGGF